MIERVCDQHKLIEHSLNFILKKKFILNGPSIYKLCQLHLCKFGKSAESGYLRG